MGSVFMKYMYTCITSFPNSENLSGINGVDIRDVIFTGEGGTWLLQYVTKGARVLKYKNGQDEN